MFLREACKLALLIGVTIALRGQAGPSPTSLPGLSNYEAERFNEGLEEFLALRDEIEGLGPAYNGRNCAGCHVVPTVGGGGPISVLRAGRRDAQGGFHEFSGNTLFPVLSIPPHRCQPRIPSDANVIIRRASPPVFGDGLLEAIPDEAIAARQDPEDRDQDGIRGRAAWITDPSSGRQRVGRFGWKAQQATLLSFVSEALRNELGITNDLFPDELAAGVDPATLSLCDTVPDPEDRRDRRTGLRGIDKLANFLRLLAPVPPERQEPNGESLFGLIGCSSCHAPVLTTGESSNPALDRKPVRLYSDLLLHDVGTGDGIPQAAALANELRTPPLWGLRFRRLLLHDGSAVTPAEAVRRHGREAERVVERYLNLTDSEREALHAFLSSL